MFAVRSQRDDAGDYGVASETMTSTAAARPMSTSRFMQRNACIGHWPTSLRLSSLSMTEAMT